MEAIVRTFDEPDVLIGSLIRTIAGSSQPQSRKCQSFPALLPNLLVGFFPFRRKRAFQDLVYEAVAHRQSGGQFPLFYVQEPVSTVKKRRRRFRLLLHTLQIGRASCR